MTRRVILHGQLGDLFGREWNLHCSTPAEALALIRANRPDIVQYLAQSTRDRVGFVVTIAGRAVDAERMLGPFARHEALEIAPALEAAGGDAGNILKIVAGVALIALSTFTLGSTAGAGAGLLGTSIGAGGTAGFVANMGVALAFSGTAGLIAGQPEFAQPEERTTENKPSYLFDGPGNSTRQGNPIPLLYGRLIIGGQPISLGINNEEWDDPADTDVGTPTGGYSDAGSSAHADNDSAFNSTAGDNYGGWAVASGGGKGGSGDGARSAVEAPDSYQSISRARIQDVLSMGELYGPLDRNGNLITSANSLGRALFLDETPVQNEDGTFNFKNVKAWFLPGTADQKHFPGFDGTEVEVSVGTEATASTSPTSTITDTTTDAIRVTVRIPQMYKRNLSNGNVDGYTVTFAIELNYDSGGSTEVLRKTIRQKNMNQTLHSYRLDLNSFSTNCVVKLVRISADEAASSTQNRTFFHALTRIQDEKLNHPNVSKIGLDADATQFSRIPARAIRLGGIKCQIPDNYDPIEKTYSGVWGGGYDTEFTDNPAWQFLDLLTNVEYGLGRWVTVTQNDVAALYTISQANDVLVSQGITVSATLVESFSTSATSIKISIPDAWIEDGDTLTLPGGDVTVDGKVRQGAQDANLTAGSLIVGAQYRIVSVAGGASFTGVGASSDAVNVLFTATGTSPTWGSGSLEPLYKTISVDSTAIAGTQDDAVAFTGKEPRFVCNLYINSRQDAFRALLDLASVFRSMPYWGAGLYKVVQDVAKTSVLQFTNANIIGSFKYSAAALKSRHTTAQVRYNDPNDFYRAKTIYVEDPAGVFKWGIREKLLTAFGCTSESQAMRYARSVLIGERLEPSIIELTVGLEGHALAVGDIIDTYDNRTNTLVSAGRLREVTTTTAKLDREVILANGGSYEVTFVLPDGTGLVTKAISTAAGTVSDITFAALTTAQVPEDASVFMIQDTSGATKRQWRILSIVESERNKYQIVGHEYNSAKFTEIEAIERQASRTPITTVRQVIPPTGLDVVTEKISTDLSADRFATATWVPSTDVNVRSYLVTSRRDDGDWEPMQETFATNLRIRLGAPGTYEFQVIAKNGLGFKSGPISTTFTLTDSGLVIGITSPPVVDPLGGIKPDATSLTDVRFLNEEGESEVRYTVTEEEQITSGTPTSGEDWEILSSTTSGEILTAGATTNLRSYRIHNNGGTGDFTNCGAADNNVGTIFTANGNTPTSYGTGGELQEDTNTDFKISGSSSNAAGTVFTANGTAPYYGTAAELRKVSDSDPLTVSNTVFNPNWLTYSNEVKNAAWTKVDGTATDEGVIQDPDGARNADQLEPSGSPKRIEFYQDVTISNLYKGQYFTFSGYERVTNSTFALVRFEIEERGGAATASSTVFDFIPTPGAWGLRSVTHQLQQTDRTTLRIKVSAENANNPNDKFLFCYGYQLESGRQRTKYVANTSTAGGKITVTSYAGTKTIRARTFVTDDVFSPMVETSYDFDDGATKVAEPDIRPHGGKFQGTEFPVTIAIEQLEPSSTTKYTTDGSDPSTGTTYSAPFEVTDGQQVRAISTKGGFTDSEEREHSFDQGF